MSSPRKRWLQSVLSSTMASLLLSLLLVTSASGLASLSSPSFVGRSILVTGANKGQGYALCERILTEYDDTRVFLCSRDAGRGEAAASSLRSTILGDDSIDRRVEVVQLDVTDPTSVANAFQSVRDKLGPDNKLSGVVSNAGVLWGYPLSELMDVCATGVRRVLDGFLPLADPHGGRVIVVSSGLGPLMHGYASDERRAALMDPHGTWDGTIAPMIDACLEAYRTTSDDVAKRPAKFESIGFPGGPFAESAPDFHMYGLAKMFADSYMRMLARSHNYPNLRINSCDPGLVYTDLILKMPKYEGRELEETGAQTPRQGVEAAMRLLFDAEEEEGEGVVSGQFYAMSKDRTKLLHSDIDNIPKK